MGGWIGGWVGGWVTYRAKEAGTQDVPTDLVEREPLGLVKELGDHCLSFCGYLGGWVGGWMEGKEAVQMRYCGSCMGGWVGGWERRTL